MERENEKNYFFPLYSFFAEAFADSLERISAAAIFVLS